ncbi:hypothetical protein [Desulfallas arcticus]|uniref:hypothetical protein n=1 Tax=Desulfotruncus arcticus TaxID=341036 RepID=UPI0013F4F2DB
MVILSIDLYGTILSLGKQEFSVHGGGVALVGTNQSSVLGLVRVFCVVGAVFERGCDRFPLADVQ